MLRFPSLSLVIFTTMNVSDVPDNLNTFLEEYMEHIGEDAKEIRRDLQLIRDLDEVSTLFLVLWDRNIRD